MKITLRAALAALLAASSCAPAMAQADEFLGSNATTPCRRWAQITPADDADLTRLPNSIYVGSGGDINMLSVEDASPVIWRNLPNAALVAVRPRRIFATGTTASNIVACY